MIIFSVANIIEEYEELQEQARIEAKSIKSNQSTPSKKRDLSAGRVNPAASATNDFSFGGPVADEEGMQMGNYFTDSNTRTYNP